SLQQQWQFAEDAAKKHGTSVNRADWRVLLSFHIAESREQARREAGAGLMRWHNEYNVGTLQRPGLTAFASPDEAVDKTAFVEGAGQAVMAKIMQNEKAAEALKVTGPGRVAIPAVNAPDLQKEAAKR